MELHHNILTKSEINLEEFPKTLTRIDLSHNDIQEINWKGCPWYLTHIDLHNNQIKEIILEDCPGSLTWIDLSENEIKEINWNDCPKNLTTIWLDYNQIQEMNWKYVPWNLKGFKSGILMNKYERYKKSRDNIPDLPWISQERKNLIHEIDHVSLLPPKISALKVFKKGGYSFRENVQELRDLGYFFTESKEELQELGIFLL